MIFLDLKFQITFQRKHKFLMLVTFIYIFGKTNVLKSSKFLWKTWIKKKEQENKQHNVKKKKVRLRTREE